MSNFVRSVLFVLLVPVGALDLPGIAQSAESKSQVAARTNIDGKFARYLESLAGNIDGIVLEDGTVARFAPFKRATQVTLLHPGDSLRVEGDVVSGLEGPYLVHARVTRIDVPTTRGAVSPTPPTGAAGSGSSPRRAGKGAKGAQKGSPQPSRVAGKPRDVLAVQSPSARTRRKGRLETVEAKASEITTGKGKNGNYSQWSRAQETAGP